MVYQKYMHISTFTLNYPAFDIANLMYATVPVAARVTLDLRHNRKVTGAVDLFTIKATRT